MSDSTDNPGVSVNTALVGLNDRQAAFVLAYVGAARGNGTEAARLAGYSPASADSKAAHLKRNPKVAAALAMLLRPIDTAKAEVAAVKALSDAVRQADRDASEALTRSRLVADREAVVSELMAIALAKQRRRVIVRGEEQTEIDLPTPKSAEQIAAARALAAMEGWDAPARVAGKIDHTHSGTVGVVNRESLEHLSDAELERQIAELERQKLQALQPH